MRVLPLLSVLLLAASVLPTASAHGAAPPPEQFTRLLSDYSDDCGPTQNLNDCRGSDDLVALDVQEVQDALVFRFVLDKGKPSGSSPITDALTLSGPSGSKTLAIKTTDDSSYSVASGFDSVQGVQSINDGSRYAVLAKVSLSSVGAAVGQKISGFKTESDVGGKPGDVMPGLCNNTLSACPAQNADGSTVYQKSDYTLRGPSYYATLTGPSGTQAATAGKDLDSPIMLTLANGLHHTHQQFTVTLAGADGVTAGFHVGDPGGMAMQYQPQVQVGLDGDSQTVLHLNLHGDRAGASGTLTVTVTSDLGGVTTLQVPYTVQAAPGTGGPDGSSGTMGGDGGQATDTGAAPSKHSPTPAAALTVLVLLGVALRRRD